MVRTLVAADAGCDAESTGGGVRLTEQALPQCLRCGGLQMAEKPREADLLPAHRGGRQQKGQQGNASCARACHVKVLSGRHSPSFEGGYTEFQFHVLPPSLVTITTPS